MCVLKLKMSIFAYDYEFNHCEPAVSVQNFSEGYNDTDFYIENDIF